jgi:hypothetical protein
VGRRETKVSRINWVVMVLVACASGMVGAALNGQARVFAPAPRVLRAERFEVLDSQHRPRAWLEVSRLAGPSLTLCGRNGKARVLLAVMLDDIPSLTFLGRNGVERVSLDVYGDEGGGLNLSDRNGKMRASLGMLLDGSPRLALADKDGRVLWKAP